MFKILNVSSDKPQGYEPEFDMENESSIVNWLLGEETGMTLSERIDYAKEYGFDNAVLILSGKRGLGETKEWKTLETLLLGVQDLIELKERRVRTPEGADHFNKPIGAIITGATGVQLEFPDMPKATRLYPRVKYEISDNNTRIDEDSFVKEIKPYKPRAKKVKKVTPRNLQNQKNKIIPGTEKLDELETEEEYARYGIPLTKLNADEQISELNLSNTLKTSVNEQIAQRIIDHAYADKDFMAWVDSYELNNNPLALLDWTRLRDDSIKKLGLDKYTEIIDIDQLSEELGEDDHAYLRSNNQWHFKRSNKGSGTGVRYTPNPDGTFTKIDVDRLTKNDLKPASKFVMLRVILQEQHKAQGVSFVDALDEANDFGYEEVVIRYLTRLTIDQWAQTSGDNSAEAVALQKIARQRFGVEDVTTEEHLGMLNTSIYNKRLPFWEVFVDATYANTQEFFRENGIEYLPVYRGMNWRVDEAPDWVSSQNVNDLKREAQRAWEEDRDQFVDDLMYGREDTIAELTQIRLNENFQDYQYNAEDTFYDDAGFDNLEEVPQSELDKYEQEVWEKYQTDNYEKVKEKIIEDMRDNYARTFEESNYEDSFVEEYIMEQVVNNKIQGDVAIQSQALSSWSTSEDDAQQFANSQDGTDAISLILSGIVPVEQIFCMSLTGLGCFSENEVVVIGDNDVVRVF